MAQEKVITGALAILKSNGEIIGKAQRISCTENERRGAVRGLGTILPQELPVLEWSGTCTFGFFNIDFRRSSVPNAIQRNVSTPEQFEDNLVLDDTGIQVDIFKKVSDAVDDNGIIQRGIKPYASIKGMFINSEDFDIQDGQISGRNQSFDYLFPIIFPTSDNNAN